MFDKELTIDLEAIKSDAEKLGREVEPESSFVDKPANRWIEAAKAKPVPNKLFEEFWYESELCFLFADTNAGKSILAVQIAERIARGASQADAQKVLYFDFELSDKQFERRYSEDYQNHFVFSENLLRVEIDLDAEQPERFKNETEWFDYSFNLLIARTGARIVIVDNITYMRDELEKSHIASKMMKMLNRLKKKYGLSILALGHTPKRDLTKPLTKNDLGGSKMLVNFADSSFAIGESAKDKNLRYVKQIKTRNGEYVYDAENVIVNQIAKDCNFLEFQPLGFAPERDHLKVLSQKDREELADKILRLSNTNMSQRLIAKETGVSIGTVNKYLKSFGKATEDAETDI
jgi:RecA-family ATPase